MKGMVQVLLISTALTRRAAGWVARAPLRRLGSPANHLTKAGSRKRVRSPPLGPKPDEDEASWEHWEFGDERFIDQAMEQEQAVDGTGATEETSEAPAEAAVDYRAAIDLLLPFVSAERLEKMKAVLGQRSGNIRFIIEDPINPSNAWACLRTLDSFGVQYVDVITNPKSYINGDSNTRYKRMGTAMGTQKWLDLKKHTDTEAAVLDMKRKGWCIVATDLSEGSQPIQDMDWAALGPVALVMGNEERGISDEMREMADHCVHMPMRGFAQSFSLSVSCAVLTSHLIATGGIRPGTLAESEHDRLLYKWMVKSVRGSRHILRRAGFDLPLRPPPDTVLDFSTETRSKSIKVAPSEREHDQVP